MQFVSSALIDLGPTSIDSSASSGLGLGPVELAGESSSEDKKEIKFLFALQNYYAVINNSSYDVLGYTFTEFSHKVQFNFAHI